MIYPQLLQSDYAKLPRSVRDFHAAPGNRHASGTVTVRHAGALARLLGFPPPGDKIPTQLDVIATEDREIWTRQFGAVRKRTTQWVNAGHLVEAAGPVRMRFRVFLAGDAMQFQLVAARFLGIPMPLRVTASVRGAGDTSWEFEVNIAWVGSYRGIMEPQ